MSLYARNFLSSFRVTPSVDVVSNVVRLNRIQCYTCLANRSFIRPETKKCREVLPNSTIDQNFYSSLEADKIRSVARTVLDKMFFLDKTKQQKAAIYWVGTLDQINYGEFLKLLKLDDTFYSWFKITELHVWMLLVRLMQNGDGLRHTRTTIIEAMWVDVEKRAKTVEPVNKNYKENMRDIYERFKFSLMLYDEGFLTNDMALAGALWFHFFEKKCDDPRLIEALISYIRYQISFLQVITVENEGRAEIKKQIWTPFKPHVEAVR